MRWTTDKIEILRGLVSQNKHAAMIAEEFGVKERTIRAKIFMLGLRKTVGVHRIRNLTERGAIKRPDIRPIMDDRWR